MATGAARLRSEQTQIRSTPHIRPAVDAPPRARVEYLDAVAAGTADRMTVNAPIDPTIVYCQAFLMQAAATCSGDHFTFRIEHEPTCGRVDDVGLRCDCDPGISVLRQSPAPLPRRGWLGGMVDSLRRA